MVMSTEALELRYGKLSRLQRVRTMIDDMCDTNDIMDAVIEYGGDRYSKGVSDGLSRASVRPGYRDMGG